MEVIQRMPTNGRKAKHWCGTLNNPSREDAWKLSDTEGEVGNGTSKLGFLIVGFEYGDYEQTPHYQFYAVFKNRVRLSQVKTILWSRGHYEACKGSPKENIEYVSKDGVVIVKVGEEPKGRGRRTDLEEIKDKIDEGAGPGDIAGEYFSQWIQYRRGFAAYRSLRHPARMRPELRVFCLEGETGVGKTRFATDVGRENGGFWISSDPNLKWFDGYRQQRVAIIDDFAGGADFRWLLRVLDIYELDVPIKGGFVAWNPDIIFITTNVPIEEWYSDVDVAPLRRRISWQLFRGRFGDMTYEDYAAEIKNKLGL